MCSKSQESEMDSISEETPVGDLKLQIETAIKNVEEIKTKQAEVSFTSQEVRGIENISQEKDDDIVLFVSIKIKKNPGDSEDAVNEIMAEENIANADSSGKGNLSEFIEQQTDEMQNMKSEDNDNNQSDNAENSANYKEEEDTLHSLDPTPDNVIRKEEKNGEQKEYLKGSEEPKGVHWFKEEWEDKEPETKEFSSTTKENSKEENVLSSVVSESKPDASFKVDLINSSETKNLGGKDTNDFKTGNNDVKARTKVDEKIKDEDEKKPKVKKKKSKGGDNEDHNKRKSYDKDLKGMKKLQDKKPRGAQGLKLALTKDPTPVNKEDKDDKDTPLTPSDVEITGKSIGKKKLKRKSKTAPSTPLKSPLTEPDRLSKAESRDETMSACNSMETLPTEFGTPKYSRIRRLRARHSQSLDRVWLPGRKESFNSRVSKKFVRNENVGGAGAGAGQYYFSGQNIQNQCRHGRGKV